MCHENGKTNTYWNIFSTYFFSGKPENTQIIYCETFNFAKDIQIFKQTISVKSIFKEKRVKFEYNKQQQIIIPGGGFTAK